MGLMTNYQKEEGWKPEYEKEPGLEAPAFSYEDLIGSGLLKLVASGAVSLGSLLAMMKMGGGDKGMLSTALKNQSGAVGSSSKMQSMKIAQANAAKPVSEGGLGLPPNNTAMDRAKAMGFDTPAYHGTSSEIDFPAFKGNPAKHGQVFVALDPSEANVHAGRSVGSRVMPLLVNKGKMAPGTAGWGGEDAYAALANKYGRDSFKVRDDYKSPVNLSILNPKNIRSRFAAFDPARRNEADLLAGLAPYAIPAGLLSVLMANQDKTDHD